MGEEVVEERKNKILQYFKGNPIVVVYLVLAFIAWFGFYVRTRGLSFLMDVTTNDYIPSDPDAMGILRYVQYLVEHGQLMTVDYMRYYPFGFPHIEEFQVLVHLIAWFYNILHFFNPTITVGYADVIYPAFAFVIALLFFFLLVKKIFDWKIALLASAFLTVLPAYLFRTLAGVSDKEAMAMIFFYAALYFFIAYILEKKLWKGIVYSILAGLSVGTVWSIWGGIVFLTTSIGFFFLILVLLGKIHGRHIGLYALFLSATILFLALFFPLRVADPIGLLTAPTYALLFLPFFLACIHEYAYTKDTLKVKKYYQMIPVLPILCTLAFILSLGILLLLLFYGPSFFTDRITNLYIDLIEPFGKNRWALTVAESHQPYFVDWASQFSLRYLIIVFIGAVLLFYETFKSLGKKAYSLTFTYALLLLAISLNRYSSSSQLNGETSLAITLYLGVILLFFGYTLFFFYQLYTKNHEMYMNFIEHLPYGYLFMSIFFVFLLIGARSAIRLLFVFAPGTAILAAVFVFFIVEYTKHISTKPLRYGTWLILAIFTLILLNGFSQAVLAQASSTGNGYNQQWQYAMDWVRENTSEDAVFAHWWDYGYYVQTGGQRATLSDGGNANPTINYLTGRYLLTGGNDTDALQILASRNATHVLVVSDEIGKYGAFSAIGADANYDRYSWISSYSLDPSQSTESENLTTLVYTGGSVLDDAFTYQETYFPAYSAAAAGFIIPLEKDANASFLGFQVPSAVVYYNGNYYTMPLHCVFFNGQEYLFSENENGTFEGLDACFQIIPVYQNNQFNGFGAGLYLSHDVWNTWFTEHYLFGKDSEYFSTVYSDEMSIPLAIYNGRIIGPHKIWEVSYPENLSIGEEFYITQLPEGVNTVREDLQ